MERKIKVVALYARKSREDNESLEGQISSLIDYCNKNNWEYEIFKEEGSASSEEWDRPELQRMIRLIENQHFDAVVVTEQSRITRADDFPKLRNILQETNCLFVTTQTNKIYDYNKPEDEFMSDIMSAVAKQEIAFAKLRLKRGVIQSAKKGNWMGKKTPVGYDYDRETKKLVPNEDAPVVKRLFEEYLNGLSTTEIAIKFNNENVITKAGIIWTSAGISRLLNNIAYAGHSLYGKTIQRKDKSTGKRITKKTNEDEQILIKNTHEPIISQEIWDEVQRIKLERNSRPIPIKFSKRKFSGLIRCGICGAVHSFQNSRGKKLRITSCQTRNYKDDGTYEVCINKGCNLSDFEILFNEKLKEYLNKLENYIDIIRNSENEQSNTGIDDITIYEQQIKKYQQDIKRIQQGYLMEIFSEKEAQDQIKKIKHQIQKIEEKIEVLKNKNQESNISYLEKVFKRLNDLITNENTLPDRDFNEILRKDIREIIYTKIKKDIHIEIIPIIEV